MWSFFTILKPRSFLPLRFSSISLKHKWHDERMRKRHGRTIRFSFRRCLVCLFLTVLGITLLFMASFFSAWPIIDGEFSLDEMNHAQCPQKDPHKEEPSLQFSNYGV